jgi:hypothetical protein
MTIDDAGEDNGSRNLLLLADDPVEPPQRLNILVVGQHQLNRRAVLEFRVDRKCQTHWLSLRLHKSIVMPDPGCFDDDCFLNTTLANVLQEITEIIRPLTNICKLHCTRLMNHHIPKPSECIELCSLFFLQFPLPRKSQNGFSERNISLRAPSSCFHNIVFQICPILDKRADIPRL